MKIIQSGFTPRYAKADFAIFGNAANLAHAQPGDVLAIANAPSSLTALASVKESVASAIAAGLRVTIGNVEAGQLTFRRLVSRLPRPPFWNADIEHILAWANTAYVMAGDKLVLAPMDVDISFDVATGGRMLAWSAAYHVPLIVTNGFRWLFDEKAFPSIRAIAQHVPWNRMGSPHAYPFTEISKAIKSSGAELWTGAGFADGLHAGSIEKAETFGFSGIYTTVQAWEAFGKANVPKNTAANTPPTHPQHVE